MSNWGWRLYHSIPTPVVTGGVHLSRFLRNLTLSFPIIRLSIENEELGKPLTMLVAGELPWAEHLPHLLFQNTAQRALLETAPLWRLPRALRRWAPSADLSLLRVDRVSSRLLFGAQYLRVPELVDLLLEVPRDINALYSGNRNRNLKNDLRRVRRNKLTTQISHEESDLAIFYQRFHLPFVQQRFGKYAWPHNLPLLRGLFGHGGLIWALQSGQRLAGCVYTQQDEELSLLAIGTVDGHDDVTELGVQVALYHALVEQAQRLGCISVNLGGSRPLLTDGNVRFKRKWGARLSQREISNHLLLHWEHMDRSTAWALRGTALVFLDGGRLSAVGALDCKGSATSKAVSRAARFLRTPGLHRLYLCSTTGFDPEVSVPDDTQLIDLMSGGAAALPAALCLEPFAKVAAEG